MFSFDVTQKTKQDVFYHNAHFDAIDSWWWSSWNQCSFISH